MNEKNLLKNVQKLFSYEDQGPFILGNLNTKRLLAEKYYDIAEAELHTDGRKTKRFRLARDIYNNIMQEYERISS